MHSIDFDDVEDVTGNAGWMYTDLLVGLMVIFLATISFIPEGAELVDKRAVQTYREIFNTPLANRYLEYDFSKVKRDINDFVAKQGFAGSESVARVRIVVSFDPNKESGSQALVRAADIATRLRTDDPALFKDSVSVLKNIGDASGDYFILEFTFARFVQVLDTTS